MTTLFAVLIYVGEGAYIKGFHSASRDNWAHIDIYGKLHWGLVSNYACMSLDSRTGSEVMSQMIVAILKIITPCIRAQQGLRECMSIDILCFTDSSW